MQDLALTAVREAANAAPVTMFVLVGVAFAISVLQSCVEFAIDRHV